MFYLLIALSGLFGAIGFLVTEKNARYLLAGYNTMPEAERAKVDLGSYLSYFKKFHLFLALSFLFTGLVLYYTAGETATGVFLAAYPILAYLYFIWSSNRLTGGQYAGTNRVAMIVLAFCLGLVLSLLMRGLSESRLLVDEQGIEITGTYGERLEPEAIESVSLSGSLPGIRMKTNGFALGKTYKGYFRTTTGEVVKLVLDSQRPPFLLITRKTGEKIYFATGEGASEAAFRAIREQFPGLFE